MTGMAVFRPFQRGSTPYPGKKKPIKINHITAFQTPSNRFSVNESVPTHSS
jgi:hypothetical protein